jgi:hypothetical protein
VRIKLEGRKRQALDGEADRAFVGMVEMVLVPVDAKQPNGQRKQEQNHPPPADSARDGTHLSVSFGG